MEDTGSPALDQVDAISREFGLQIKFSKRARRAADRRPRGESSGRRRHRRLELLARRADQRRLHHLLEHQRDAGGFLLSKTEEVNKQGPACRHWKP